MGGLKCFASHPNNYDVETGPLEENFRRFRLLISLTGSLIIISHLPTIAKLLFPRPQIVYTVLTPTALIEVLNSFSFSSTCTRLVYNLGIFFYLEMEADHPRNVDKLPPV
jgi:hypothetical protein